MALQKITPYASGMKRDILAMIQENCPDTDINDHGLTPDEFQKRYGGLIVSIRPRFTDLRNDGYIRPTERTRTNENGNESTVWVLGRDPDLDKEVVLTYEELEARVKVLEQENAALNRLVARLNEKLKRSPYKMRLTQSCG